MTKRILKKTSKRYRRKKGGMNGKSDNKKTATIKISTSDLFTPLPDKKAATAKYTFRKGDIKTSQNTIDFEDNPLFDEAAQNLERIDMTKADREAHSQRLDEIIKTYDDPMDDFGKKDDGCPETGCIISGGRKTRRYRRQGRKSRKSRRR